MNGSVYLAIDIERANNPTYEIFIFATDSVFTVFVKFVITVIESNEFDPIFTTDNATSFTLQEDYPLSLIVTLNISDLDFGLSGQFDVSVSNPLFEIVPDNGNREAYLEVSLVTPFDYEVILYSYCIYTLLLFTL